MNEVGYNYRMTNLQAALGVAQLEELPEFIRRKQRNYALYQELFSDMPLVKILPFREGTDSNQWFYALDLSMEKICGSLYDVMNEMEKRGVQTRAIWGLVHEQKPYKNAIAYQIEKAVYYSGRILNIPCSTQITEQEIREVASVLTDVLGEMSYE